MAVAPSRSCTTAMTSWPQRSRRPARAHHVVHVGVVGDGLLDLLGEDLLAAGVDGDRVAAVQLDDAVGGEAGPVAGHGVAGAVDHREGARRLLGVAEVAERHPALLGQPPDLGVPRLERGGQVVAHDGRARARA